MKGKCRVCVGTGRVVVKENGKEKEKTCDACEGTGEMVFCDFCNRDISPNAIVHVCTECEKEKNVVYQADDSIDYDDLIPMLGKIFLGKVKRVEKIGFFVEINSNLLGLIRRKNVFKPIKIGDEVFVRVRNVNPLERKLDLDLVDLKNFTIYIYKKELERTKIGDISIDNLNKVVKIGGIVTRVKGNIPIYITILDETGSIDAVSFKSISVDVDEFVYVTGTVILRDRLIIDVKTVEKPRGKEYIELKKAVEESIEKKSEPEDIGFLIESDVLKKLKEKIVAVAREIKKAVITNTPILIRHHADADGYVGGIALEQAILPLIRKYNPDPEAEWHYYKRSPSRAPFYELEDVVKDLDYAHDDARRFGQKMPLIVLVDNGSTREDVPAIKQVKVYGCKVIVIDHHYPGEIKNGRAYIDDYVDIHINPYLVGYDYNLPSGAIATEVARFVNPSISDKIKHLPAVSCVADRVESKERELYLKLAEEKGYNEEYLMKIAESIDFEAYYLRFLDGKTLIEDLLALNRLDRHRKLLEAVYEEAKNAKERQLLATLPNTKTVKLSNGIVVSTIDLDMHSFKFTFPAAGKTCGLVHDEMVKKYEKHVLTIGYGKDFAVVRATNDVARDYGFNLNDIIEEIKREVPNSGVDGGGHEVAGSIKFVEGYRKSVLEKFVEKISKLRKRENA